jgi:hypothetical protein
LENKHGILEFGKGVDIFFVAAKLNDISTATEKKTVSTRNNANIAKKQSILIL